MNDINGRLACGGTEVLRLENTNENGLTSVEQLADATQMILHTGTSYLLPLSLSL